jgi:hypothetical protein
MPIRNMPTSSLGPGVIGRDGHAPPGREHFHADRPARPIRSDLDQQVIVEDVWFVAGGDIGTGATVVAG